VAGSAATAMITPIHARGIAPPSVMVRTPRSAYHAPPRAPRKIATGIAPAERRAPAPARRVGSTVLIARATQPAVAARARVGLCRRQQHDSCGRVPYGSRSPATSGINGEARGGLSSHRTQRVDTRRRHLAITSLALQQCAALRHVRSPATPPRAPAQRAAATPLVHQPWDPLCATGIVGRNKSTASASMSQRMSQRNL
jgi:hypothetical protein